MDTRFYGYNPEDKIMYEENGYYAVIRKYATVETDDTDEDGYTDWYYLTKDYERIYNTIMTLNDGNHEEAIKIVNWCKTAPEYDIWEFSNGAGEVEIQYIT